MRELIKSISKKEWWFVVIMATVMIVLTGIPYLYGWLAAPPDTIYNGLHALSPGDIPIYYSYINQIKEGNILVKNLFTSEPQTIGTFNVWWFWLGAITKLLNLPIILTFQLSRIIMIPIFLLVAYIFISFFIDKKIKREICLIFLLFSAGVGFYFAGAIDQINIQYTPYYFWPIDLWLTEAIIFNVLYQSSHFIASITLTLLMFLLTILAFEKQKLSYAIVSGILGLFYFNFHPYYFPVIFGTLGLYLFVLMLQTKKILWRSAGYLITVLVISLPSIIYHFWLIQKSPVIAQRALQNVTHISPVIFVIIGYGFLWFGFLLGLFFLIKERKLNNRFIFLLIWLAVNLILIYSPFPFHSRYTQGLHFILVVFTVIGLFALRNYLKIKLPANIFNFWVNNPTLLVLLFFVLFSMASLYSLARDIYYFTYKPGQAKIDLYLPNDVVGAIKWLSHQPRSKVILAADIPSKFIPGFSGQTVYLAHGHETLFYSSKFIYLVWFFEDNEYDRFKHQFLIKQGIDYIFYTDYEKGLGSFNPASKDYLKLVFDLPQAQIYQVVK